MKSLWKIILHDAVLALVIGACLVAALFAALEVHYLWNMIG